MKIQSLLVGLAVAASLGLAGCAQATTTTTASTDYSGTGRYVFPVHQSGVIADVSVTTDKDGAVTNAVFNEWQNPNSWVTMNGSSAFDGTEVFRVKVPGANSTSTDAEIKGFSFFHALINGTGTGWVEFVPSSTAFSATNKVANLDLKMASPIYAKAYADAAAADNATDLVNVTISAAGVVTVGSKASATVRTGAMNKNATASTYFPVTASSLGYKENSARLLAFFKANPTANYEGSATKTATWASYSSFVAPSATYTATSDSVWTLTINGADAVTGATYSDFPAYALGLQTAYLYAIGDIKGGNVRALSIPAVQ